MENKIYEYMKYIKDNNQKITKEELKNITMLDITKHMNTSIELLREHFNYILLDAITKQWKAYQEFYGDCGAVVSSAMYNIQACMELFKNLNLDYFKTLNLMDIILIRNSGCDCFIMQIAEKYKSKEFLNG